MCRTSMVILINVFSVPREEGDRFLGSWKDSARIMAQQPGFIRARMCRSLADDGERQFVNVAEWESWELLDQATANPEFRASTRRMLDDPELHVRPGPGRYEVAVEVHPGDTL